MPKFLDSHELKGANPETLKKLQNAPKDEFGVTHLNLIYSEDEDKGVTRIHYYCKNHNPNSENS